MRESGLEAASRDAWGRRERGERESIVVVVLVVTGLREAIGAVLVVSVMRVVCGVVCVGVRDGGMHDVNNG